MQHLKPDSEAQVVAAVQAAIEGRRRIEVIGLGSKRGIGKPVEADDLLDLSGLTGILDYDPAELVLTARAGTPLSQVQGALDEARQHLAFEPFRPGALLGTEDQTLGGMVAAGLAGPRRLQAGSVRDHVLGFRAVSGRGEAFKAGGKVVKNVTGFDLSKAMAGSWGTLAVLTEVTLKVLPAPETALTLSVPLSDPAAAAGFLASAMGSPAEVSGAAWRNGQALVRLEGIDASVAYRAGLIAALAPAPVARIEGAASASLWAGLRDGAGLPPGGAVWRLSCPPMQGPDLLAALTADLGATGFCDWQGGLVWAHLPQVSAKDLRAALARHRGGHATLIRADINARLATPCFEPLSPGLAALTQRLREAFDPLGLLNPGRMD